MAGYSDGQVRNAETSGAETPDAQEETEGTVAKDSVGDHTTLQTGPLSPNNISSNRGPPPDRQVE